jgi:hypothetical protein
MATVTISNAPWSRDIPKGGAFHIRKTNRLLPQEYFFGACHEKIVCFDCRAAARPPFFIEESRSPSPTRIVQTDDIVLTTFPRRGTSIRLAAGPK